MITTFSTNKPVNKIDLLPHFIPASSVQGLMNLFGPSSQQKANEFLSKTTQSFIPQSYASESNYSGPIGPSSPGYVQGTANTVMQGPSTIANQQATQQANSAPAPAPSGGSRYDELKAIANAGDLNPAQRTEFDQLRASMEQGNQDINAEIENAFNATMNYAGGLEGSLRDQDVATRNMINQEYAQSQGALERERGLGEEKIGMQEAQGGRVKEDAMSSARRLYNELLTGGQQRFGGASSAGEAFQALGGRELQRNNAQIQQNYSSFMEQINYAKNELQNKVISATENIELQKNKALESANTLFRNALSEINRIKAGAAEDKAQRRLGALQDYRNQLVQISMAEAEMKNQVNNYAAQTGSVLDGYVQQASQSVSGANQAGQTFGETTPLNYTTGLGISTGRGPSGFDTRTGMINFRSNPDEEEQLISAGRIAPRDDLRSQLGFFNR